MLVLLLLCSIAIPADAQPRRVTSPSASLTLVGSRDDGLIGATTLTFATPADAISVTTDDDQRGVHVEASDATDWFLFDLTSGTARTLEVGTYAAIQFPDIGTRPGLALAGDGAGCGNTSYGTFTVNSITKTPEGWVKDLDTSFEYHCSAQVNPVRGRLKITRPWPVRLSVANSTTADTVNPRTDTAHVAGTLTCSRAIDVGVSGAVTVVRDGRIVVGWYGVTVACAPGASMAWAADAIFPAGSHVAAGWARVDAKATAEDPAYGIAQATDLDRVWLRRVMV